MQRLSADPLCRHVASPSKEFHFIIFNFAQSASAGFLSQLKTQISSHHNSSYTVGQLLQLGAFQASGTPYISTSKPRALRHWALPPKQSVGVYLGNPLARHSCLASLLSTLIKMHAVVLQFHLEVSHFEKTRKLRQALTCQRWQLSTSVPLSTKVPQCF